MVLSAEVDFSLFNRLAKFWPRKSKMEIGDALDHISLHFLKEFRLRRLSGRPGVQGHPRGIFSTFKRAFLVSNDVSGMGVKIWSDSPVALIHQTGGIVRNPKGGMLAVPLSARTEMFTSKGRLRARFKDPKKIKGIFPERINSNVFLMQRKRKGEKKPLFVLKSQVRIPARLEFFRVWDSLENFRINRINKALDRVLESL